MAEEWLPEFLRRFTYKGAVRGSLPVERDVPDLNIPAPLFFGECRTCGAPLVMIKVRELNGQLVAACWRCDVVTNDDATRISNVLSLDRIPFALDSTIDADLKP